ncbi:hypothetical protein EDC01DRAFT_306414 [Geopyxis carbonaria]|nr:hypothetical protein EDC01DRAFT_306414 [Geopyxis carbonaria]
MEVINRKFTKPPNVKAVQTDSLIVAKKSSIPVGKTWYRILQLPSGLLRAAFFAIRIPLVLADTGDDFSNNLFSDLAPVLALFGEQVAKQYLSQSTTFTEDLIFAMAPLGIITAITAAIRVDGTAWMKAAIGRAREGKGQVEIELMSSTSPDVCELWTGDSVVRVLGTPSIFEIYYVESAPGDFSNDEDQVELLSGLDPSGIYDSRTAKAAQIITTDQRTNVQSGNSSKVAPNIALNISGAKISKFEFLVVAATGTALQLGVLVFAGFSVLSSSRNDKFQKNNREVQSYAFPAMVTGTVTLVIGMFICAHIIDRSTAETTWDIKPRPGTKVEVAWLQQGGNVNDQLFDSYLIRRASAPPEIEWPAIISPFLSRKSVVRSWLSTNSRFQIRTSYKDHHRNSGKSSLITVAIPLSVLGFIIQFVGLRGLNWKVAIAQLLAIVLMTCLRAWGYELETVAQQIKHCKNWSVVTWGFDRDSSYIKENNLGLAVLQARCRLDKLSQWGCKWKTAVDSTTAAIEATMNFLCTSGEVKIKPWSNVFQWKLFVDVVPVVARWSWVEPMES